MLDGSVENEQPKSSLVDPMPLKKFVKRKKSSKKTDDISEKKYKKYVVDQELIPYPLIDNNFIHKKNDTKVLKRSKRSSKRRRIFGPSSDKLYRHPNLSYEEQQRQLNETFHAKDVNLNLNSSNHRFSASETRKHSYVPVLVKCDDTSHSEADDMVKTTRKNWKNIEESDKNDSSVTEKSEGPSEESKSKNLIEHRNKTYINIRDHQKNIEDTTDIPEYDPNKIPYVEVPDYSDIREESLDEEDRKANKKRKMKQENIDFLDPSISLDEPEENDEYGSSKGSNNDSNKKQKNLKGSSKSLDADKETKENSKSLHNADIVENSQKNFSNDFNNHELKISKNFKEPSESLNTDFFKENNEDESLKDWKENLNIKSNFNSSDPKQYESSKPSGMNDSERNKKDEPQKSSKRKSNDNSRFKGLAFEDDSESREDPDDRGEGGSAGPIIFDINEYRKPFDLDEFLKDDPIMKKLESLGKETLTKYGKNGKRVSADFNESESDNAAEKRSPEERDDDRSTKLRQSNDFVETVTAKHDQNNDAKKKPRNKVNQGSENRGDSKLRRFLFKETEENDEFFKDDIVGNFREDEREENKKNIVSGLNEGIDRGIETGDESGLVYKNFWSLEFKSPLKKIDMEAQETKR